MKASRLLSILMLLQARGRMTAPALAEAMEVSVRTILRDVDQLSAAGVPLWGARGRQGGFQLREGWSTALTGMTEPEANALLLAGLPAAATELGLGRAAASARLKLLASLPAPWRAQADRVSARLHIDPVEWYRAADTPHRLQAVADAVWHARPITVTYESWRGTSRLALEPLGLVLKAGAWYLVARPAGQASIRTYRLASVRELVIAGPPFKRPRGFDLPQFWQASAARFEAELHGVPARIRVSPRGLTWLANARSRFVVVPADSASDPPPEGWQEVEIAIESIAHGARQLLGMGAEVEVLAPAELRAEVLRLAAAVLARHGPPAVRKKSRPGAAPPR